MSNNYAAHSSPKDRPEDNPHSYADHVRAVERLGLRHARNMFKYANLSPEGIAKYTQSLNCALRIHDIGKLEAGNQAVLSGKKTGKLPYDHVDAGVAIALAQQDQLTALLIRAHHAPGLASTKDEGLLKRRLGEINLLRGKRHQRNSVEALFLEEHKKLIDRTDALVNQLRIAHESSCDDDLTKTSITALKEGEALTIRLLLSCLVDADHSDAAAYYARQAASLCDDLVKPKWSERLQQLTRKINALQGDDPERQVLRDELFSQCLNNDNHKPIVTCAAPVGLGKTTAVSANLLQRAIQHDLRRIFVIAPFTNVISQTAKRLRDYLVLDGEDPNTVIVEHHHRAEFDSVEKRQYTETWQAPIIVTTAVQFFETLASASPTPLRKLHQLPGSAIFIDEAHACVSPHLMRQTWHWIKQLAATWSCHAVLASGSLVKYWEDREIVGGDNAVSLMSLLQQDFFQVTQAAEHSRLKFARLNDGKDIDKSALLNAVAETDIQGSRLIILNTVQSAAVIAQALQQMLQPDIGQSISLAERKVLHLSTALAPVDRARVIDELSSRQRKDSYWKNKDWFLAATSCVEAGVDLDFDFGFRERCSMTSFLQTAGRINREGLNPNSTLYDFFLSSDEGILHHPGFKDSIQIFDNFWEKLIAKQDPLDELSTLAIKEEIRRIEASKEKTVTRLAKDENNHNFQQVQKTFKIILSDTITVIVDEELKESISKNIPVSYKKIQNQSIQIWRNKIEQFGITPCEQESGIYFWNYGYDPDFLGYMKDMDRMIRHSGWII